MVTPRPGSGRGWIAHWAQSAIDELDFTDIVFHGVLGLLLFAGSLHIDWSDIGNTTTNLACPLGCRTTNNWLGTLRGRIGYAADRIMPYLTGGLAFGDIKANALGTPAQTATRAGARTLVLTHQIPHARERVCGRVDCHRASTLRGRDRLRRGPNGGLRLILAGPCPRTRHNASGELPEAADPGYIIGSVSIGLNPCGDTRRNRHVPAGDLGDWHAGLRTLTDDVLTQDRHRAHSERDQVRPIAKAGACVADAQ